MSPKSEFARIAVTHKNEPAGSFSQTQKPNKSWIKKANEHKEVKEKKD